MSNLAFLEDVAPLIAPELIMIFGVFFILLVDVLLSKTKATSRALTGYVALIVPLLALVAVAMQFGMKPLAFGLGDVLQVDQMTNLDATEQAVYVFRLDDLSRFFSIVFLIVLSFVIVASWDYMRRVEHEEVKSNAAVFYALLLMATTGMMFVAKTHDLIALIVAWELGSIPSYGLTAFNRRNKRNIEAAMKFFLLGAFSTAMLLYGASLIFGVTGSTNFSVIASTLQAQFTQLEPLYVLGLVFLVAGLGFKMALFPFYYWVPDTYQGAPNVITAFLAAGSKKMGFAAVLRILLEAFSYGTIASQWQDLFAVLAVLTMTAGNLAALTQEDVKRMLAYSSIAHAGYIIVGIAVIARVETSSAATATALNLALAGILVHVLAHALMKLAGFFLVDLAEAEGLGTDRQSFQGWGSRHPMLGLTFIMVMFSLMGVPPLLGFWGKALLVLASLQAHQLYLGLLLVLNSALSVAYYLRFIRPIFAAPDETTEVVSMEMKTRLTRIPTYHVTLLLVVLLLLLGILPAFFDWVLNISVLPA